MNFEDDNHAYDLMLQGRREYLEDMQREATSKGVKISQFELEEIEMAFEHAFALGYVACLHRYKKLGSGALN